MIVIFALLQATAGYRICRSDQKISPDDCRVLCLLSAIPVVCGCR
ncbi:hypothetical protein BMETH_1022_0 [methanotrophic bacterial endosymbiont of Bathymodiolus sp.]|nr:hypothetical protein BMETH_1022_0 [methanotrophic bacterial endosymbiont of Bathymodiolus sp.]